MTEIDMDLLKEIVALEEGVTFSPEHIAVVVSEDDVTGGWEEELSSLDIESLVEGEWSMTEPDDGDYGSVVLERLGHGIDVVTDDFELGKHKFRKKF